MIRCSSLPRLAQCPGSLRASKGIPSQDTAQAFAGNAGHAALENYYSQVGAHKGIEAFTETLDAQTRIRAEWYARIVDEQIQSMGQWSSRCAEVEMYDAFLDLSGHADLLVVFASGEVLVVDYKFNFLEVETAGNNEQLLGYAVLAGRKFNAESVTVMLVAGGNEVPFTLSKYSKDDIEKAMMRVVGIGLDAKAENAIRVPSQQSCKYCQAFATSRCPESLNKGVETMELIKREDMSLLPNPAKCAEIFAQLKEIEKLGEKFKAMLKEDVANNPEAYAGVIGLKQTGSTTEITDAQAAYSVLVDQAGLTTPQAFLRAVKLPVTALEKICKDVLKARDVPVKNHRAEIEALLGDLIVKKEKAPSLELI